MPVWFHHDLSWILVNFSLSIPTCYLERWIYGSFRKIRVLLAREDRISIDGDRIFAPMTWIGERRHSKGADRYPA
jgi:hypothetical protein